MIENALLLPIAGPIKTFSVVWFAHGPIEWISIGLCLGVGMAAGRSLYRLASRLIRAIANSAVTIWRKTK